MFTQFLLLVFVANVVPSDHDPHAQRPRRDFNNQLIRKTALPLVTRLSSSEVQWIALRNVDLLLQKRSNIFSNEMRVFFCEYNDTLYVKMANLDIMVRLSNVNNVDALLSEL
jgi:AP-1 complex subunit beta-1